MVDETGLESLCRIGNNAKELRKLVTKLYKEDFEESEIEKRREVLTNFSNSYNVSNLIGLIESCEKSTVLVTSMVSPSI